MFGSCSLCELSRVWAVFGPIVPNWYLDSSRTGVTGLTSGKSKEKRENDESYGLCETFLILS